MNNKGKGFAVLFMTVTALAVGGVFTINEITNPGFKVAAAVCEHEGNHYSKLEPTQNTSGTAEYWVCCKCHEHFLTMSEGTTYIWSEAGTAAAVTEDDDRYLAPVTSELSELLTVLRDMGFGAETNADGETATITSYSGSNANLTIPEGVTGIADGTFKFGGSAKGSWIVLPESIVPSQMVGMFANNSGKVTLYFRGTNTYSASELKCKAVYQKCKDLYPSDYEWYWDGTEPKVK